MIKITRRVFLQLFGAAALSMPGVSRALVFLQDTGGAPPPTTSYILDTDGGIIETTDITLTWLDTDGGIFV
jgi:hypothetical protein